MVVARRLQVPLKCAWALSIHKAQGMTLEAAALDLGGCWAAGQAYTALSRMTGLARTRLLSFDAAKVIAGERVLAFYRGLEAHAEDSAAGSSHGEHSRRGEQSGLGGQSCHGEQSRRGAKRGRDGEGRCAPTDGHDSGAARPPAQLAELSQAELQRTGVVSTAQRTAGFQGALSLVEKAEQLKTVLGVTGNLVEVASSAAELLDLAPLAPADGRPLNVVLNQCYELIS